MVHTLKLRWLFVICAALSSIVVSDVVSNDDDFYSKIRLPEPDFMVKLKQGIAQEQARFEQEIDDLYFRNISDNCYPFEGNPTLSWNIFEQNLRQRHATLHIPPIKTPSFPTKPMYNPIRKVLQVTPEYFVSPEDAEATILHEVGHSYYPEHQRQQNTLESQQLVAQVNRYVQPAAVGLLAGLTYANGRKLLLKKPSFALLLVQAALMKIMHSDPVSAQITPRVAIRREEYAADDFANQHMSKEALQAAKYLYSKEGYVKYDDTQRFKTVMPEVYEQIEAFENRLPATLVKWLRASNGFLNYELRGITTPSHPSPQERQAAVVKALKDRFGE